MKLSVLDMVVDIMNDMDSDLVNSIDDTVESQQVAQIIKSSYLAMMSNRNWPHMRKLISLIPSSDTALPTHMRLDDKCKELIFINYNKAKIGETSLNYSPVKWLDPDDFLRMSNTRKSEEDRFDIITDVTGIQLVIQNDRAPQYYTSFDDNFIVFDSYDSAVDDSLQSSKVQAQGYIYPTFTMVDDFVPDLPDEAFIALLEESKSRAMFKLKQMVDQKAEQEAARQNRWLSRKAWRVNQGNIYPSNYGRRSRK